VPQAVPRWRRAAGGARRTALRCHLCRGARLRDGLDATAAGARARRLRAQVNHELRELVALARALGSADHRGEDAEGWQAVTSQVRPGPLPGARARTAPGAPAAAPARTVTARAASRSPAHARPVGAARVCCASTAAQRPASLRPWEGGAAYWLACVFERADPRRCAVARSRAARRGRRALRRACCWCLARRPRIPAWAPCCRRAPVPRCAYCGGALADREPSRAAALAVQAL